VKQIPDHEETTAREHSRLVARLVRRFFLRGGDSDDLYQEGMIGLLYAIRNYNPARSDSFEAYATLCIRSRLYDAVRNDLRASQRDSRLAEKLEPNPKNTKDPETLLLANETAKEIQEALGGLLSAFEASVLGPYLEGYTVNEIASGLKRDAKSVDNAVRRIRRKLATYLQGDNRG